MSSRYFVCTLKLPSIVIVDIRWHRVVIKFIDVKENEKIILQSFDILIWKIFGWWIEFF